MQQLRKRTGSFDGSHDNKRAKTYDSPMKWVSVEKGDEIPKDAILAGKNSRDGVLYVAKAPNGEIGKLNTENKKVCHIWVHHAGKYEEGHILCCPEERVAWCPYEKGEALPAFAYCTGSTFHKDGDACLYVGRPKSQKSVGKINLHEDGVTMHNLWCQDLGRCTRGEILVELPEIHKPEGKWILVNMAPKGSTITKDYSNEISTRTIKTHNSKVEIGAEAGGKVWGAIDLKMSAKFSNEWGSSYEKAKIRKDGASTTFPANYETTYLWQWVGKMQLQSANLEMKKITIETEFFQATPTKEAPTDPPYAEDKTES